METVKLKLGILGLSDGNGHPYSWSAIFNGYERDTMELCGYPAIPRYLEQQQWPECQIPDAEVVAVWTQDDALSRKIAKATRIPNVVSTPEQMIEKVDAVLLARDDAENHLELATPFLKAGLPIYIDKPVALSISDLNKLYELERYPGQIFTCSALRYSKELWLSQEDKEEIGEICQIIACTPKSWEKYAVHIIEPVLNLLKESDQVGRLSGGRRPYNDSSASLLVDWESGVQTAFFATGNGLTPITIKVIGRRGSKDLVFTDSFSAFKSALQKFVVGIREQAVISPKSFNMLVVRLLEGGGL